MKNHLRRIKRLAGGGARVCHHHFFLPPAGLEFVIGCASSVTGFYPGSLPAPMARQASDR